MNFESTKILITGGSKGIGKAIIAEIYKKGAKKIAVVGRNLEDMQALGNEFPNADFEYIQGDVSKPDDIKNVISRVEKKWGIIDILINNAGVVSAGKLEEINDEDIIAQQNINVTGLILLTKHALPLLKKSEGASIINVSSGLGLIAMPFYAPYAATKAAVKHFSEAIRRELAPFNIHVMTVYPTATDTPMMKTAPSDGMDSAELVAKKTIDGLENREIDVILGGAQRLANVKDNAENPQEFDKKVKGMYDAMLNRASGHRSM